MKLKKLTAVISAAVMMCAAFSGCGNGKDSSGKGEDGKTDKGGNVVMNAENVKLLGRTHLIDDTLWLAFSGTGADFDYTGKKLEVTLVGDAAASGGAENQVRAAVYVDGERVIDQMLDEPEKTLTVFESEESKTVNVKIIKLSETAMSTMGIKPIKIAEGEKIAPAAAKAHRIEFVGDSITCGYGVDDEVKEHHFVTGTEDVTKAYAYKTAQALDADYSMVSISGYGIISGYTNGDKKISAQTIPQYYEKMGFSYNSFAETEKPESIDWDFSEFVPEVVVINLGTNDESYCKSYADRKEEYRDAYIEFIKKVREKNPDATIICALGIMGAGLYPTVEEAVNNYQEETGDQNVYSFRLTPQDGSLGYAADWHPTAATHDKAAEELSAKIKEIMGW